MKTCFKCNVKKPLTSFYKHPRMSDGRVNKCKECNKVDVVKNRNDKIEYYREYDKGRASLPHRVKARREYALTDGGKIAQANGTKRYREKFPNKYRATNTVNNAIRAGKLCAEPCEICESTENIHGHHDDYLKPLNVRWLCCFCHTKWHKTNKPLNP